MRKTIYILVLFAFLFANIGYSYLLIFEQDLQSFAMKEKMEDVSEKDVIALLIPASEKKDLEWKSYDEVEYKGELYDVTEVIDLGSGVIKLICYSDSKEKSIIETLNEVVKGNHDASKSEKSNDLTKNLAKDYFQNNISYSLVQIPSEILFWEIIALTNSYSQELIIPPPNC